MKILQITFSLSAGGAERFVADLSNELSKTNEVVIVQILSNDVKAHAHSLPDLSKKIKYINLGSKTHISLSVIIKIYKVVKKESPDIVHAHCTLMTLALASILCQKPKYFHTLHSLAERCLSPKYMKFFYSYLYKNRVQPITISKVCYESYVKLYSQDNALLITNGRSPICTTVDLNSVKEEIRSMMNHHDDKIFIHVARFHPVKNQKLLFSTFRRLINEGEHVILVVVGNGFEKSEIYNNSYSKGIYFVGGKRNVGDYLSCANYFIMSSINEGLPMSLLEAMSIGLVPVSTPAGGICDVVINHVTGYLSKTHYEEDYYITVKEAISNVAGIKADDIKREYEEKYSMFECSSKYIAAYKGN